MEGWNGQKQKQVVIDFNIIRRVRNFLPNSLPLNCMANIKMSQWVSNVTTNEAYGSCSNKMREWQFPLF